MDDMLRGYLAGFNAHGATHPPIGKSAAFKHGWMNGRDDRLGMPREKASVLRNRAKMILGTHHAPAQDQAP